MKAPDDLLQICSHWEEALYNLSTAEDRMAFMRNVLPDLLLNRNLIGEILAGAAKGRGYPDLRRATLFEDEYILYLDPRNMFSLRMYIHSPGHWTPVHDHNAWGVYGNAAGRLDVVRYEREDNEERPGFAHLKEKSRRQLRPGDTECVLPLNGGIHQTGNTSDRMGVMVNVYGRPLRRLHINRFDLATGRVSPMHPPRIRKKMLARQALESLMD